VSAVYAGSLAWVVALQADTDRQLIAERQPVGDAIDMLRVHHDAMTVRVGDAWGAYQEATETFSDAADRASELNAQLAGLADRVADVVAVAGAIPQRIYLPAVSKVTVPKSVNPRPVAPPPPPTNATSGASGG
jgi:hypothetical protein